MKKYFFLILLFSLVIPQIMFAAWWNPLTWFNSWKFSNPVLDVQTQELENRIKELEQKIQDNNISTTTPEQKSTSTVVNKILPSIKNQPSVVNSKIVPITPKTIPSITPTPTLPPKDFRANCVLSEKSVESGDSVTAKIDIQFESNSAYKIVWPTKYLTKIIDNNEALFNPVSTTQLGVTVTRLADGYSKIVNCTLWVDEKNLILDDQPQKTKAQIEEENCQLKKIEKVDITKNIYDIEEKYRKIIEAAKLNPNGMSSGALNSEITRLSNKKLSETNPLYDKLMVVESEISLYCY
ncbi:MAG: hypothetical protein KBC48_03055 [Candidatus Pacebacteria bacterium]|nr:hypothetical protein [Candidatus Paceibacterota bacterium]